jgi:Tol biopolymer transport system component
VLASLESDAFSWLPDGDRVAFAHGATLAIAEPRGSFRESCRVQFERAKAPRADTLVEHASRGASSRSGDRIAFLLFGTPRRDTSGAIVGSDIADRRSPNVNLAMADSARRRIETLMPLGTMGSVAAKAPPGLGERQLGEYRPMWSSDGRRLLVRDPSRNVLLVNAHGSGEGVRFGDVEPSWSPDGTMIALATGLRTSGELLGLERAPADAVSVQRAVRVAARSRAPAVSSNRTARISDRGDRAHTR